MSTAMPKGHLTCGLRQTSGPARKAHGPRLLSLCVRPDNWGDGWWIRRINGLLAPPRRPRPPQRTRRRPRRAHGAGGFPSAPLGSRPVCAARGAPVRPGGRARRCPGRRLVLALTRRDARQRRSGWPWSSSLRWRRVDRWRAGEGRWQALRKQGQGACSCLVQVGWGAGGVRCRKVATLPQAPSGSGAQGRERRAALSSVAISPRGVARWRASAKTRSPSEAVNAAIACVSARPAERPRQLAGLPAPALPGCQPLLKRVRGSAPHNPGRRSPSRVGVGGEV